MPRKQPTNALTSVEKKLSNAITQAKLLEHSPKGDIIAAINYLNECVEKYQDAKRKRPVNSSDNDEELFKELDSYADKIKTKISELKFKSDRFTIKHLGVINEDLIKKIKEFKKPVEGNKIAERLIYITRFISNEKTFYQSLPSKLYYPNPKNPNSIKKVAFEASINENLEELKKIKGKYIKADIEFKKGEIIKHIKKLNDQLKLNSVSSPALQKKLATLNKDINITYPKWLEEAKQYADQYPALSNYYKKLKSMVEKQIPYFNLELMNKLQQQNKTILTAQYQQFKELIDNLFEDRQDDIEDSTGLFPDIHSKGLKDPKPYKIKIGALKFLHKILLDKAKIVFKKSVYADSPTLEASMDSFKEFCHTTIQNAGQVAKVHTKFLGKLWAAIHNFFSTLFTSSDKRKEKGMKFFDGRTQTQKGLCQLDKLVENKADEIKDELLNELSIA